MCVCEVSLHVKIRGKGIVFIDEKPRSFLSACISRWLPNQRELLVRKKVRNEKQAKKKGKSVPPSGSCVFVQRFGLNPFGWTRHYDKFNVSVAFSMCTQSTGRVI